jgi:hypothetical protein
MDILLYEVSAQRGDAQILMSLDNRERAGAHPFIVKGGTAMQLRLGIDTAENGRWLDAYAG